MTITISGSGTIGGPTTFTDNVTLGTSLLATPSGATPSYLCRAWVNFNGQGTVAIRASGNVSSITDNGTGDYTVNFTTALPDTNYAVGPARQGADIFVVATYEKISTTQLRIRTGYVSSGGDGVNDSDDVSVNIFR